VQPVAVQGRDLLRIEAAPGPKMRQSTETWDSLKWRRPQQYGRPNARTRNFRQPDQTSGSIWETRKRVWPRRWPRWNRSRRH